MTAAQSPKLGRPFLDPSAGEAKNVTVRIPGPLLQRIDQTAAESGLSRSEVVREAVEAQLGERP